MKRSAEVEELLDKKNGFILTHGNLLVILFIFFGIIASKKIEYPVYKSYNLTRVSNYFSIPSSSSDYIIKIPFSDLRQYNLKENQSSVFVTNDNQNLQIGILGNQVDSQRKEGSFDLLMTDSTLFEYLNSKDSINFVLIRVGRTSLFEQFSSQFNKNVSLVNDY